ncbi:hypothetical protein T4E_3906 [Trichinella pseudospiralis]|uniref:Uncharacterized protein n=1 Tax=Trichinella pseudospiralis TaxID=6337 RepID=A0A0V0Y7F9_TRIPS|nr:hypothetical protein T4E_3906 [Trichinella pseudospiralis]
MLRKLQRYSFQEHPDLALTLLKVESKLEEMEAEKRIKRSHQSKVGNMCKRAHGAVVYLCVESGTQRASQPGHIQRMNHPRLELMGPLMAARLVRILFSTLNLTVVLLVRQLCVHCLGAFTGGTMETFRTESRQ